MARVAIAGATGLVGREVARVLRAGGHEVAEISRSAGVDILDGAGLDEALAGASAVIDVLNTPELAADRAIAFFETTTRNLLGAERRAGVGHHVLLSIVNVDAVEKNGHYAGKRAQERLVRTGPVPWTIQRATQFFDFAGMVASWTTRDGVATVAPLLVQPVAVADVAGVLADAAVGPAQEMAPDLAGPEPLDFVDMARRTLAARGETTGVRASWRDGPFGTEMGGEVLLPGPDARLGPATFESWLSQQGPRAAAETYFAAWQDRDFGRLRSVLADDATFRGPLGTADSGDECLAGLRGMAEMLTRVNVLKMWVNGPDVLTWFDLHTTRAAPAPTANWMHVEDGKITRIRVTFDPREITGQT
ncbi:MAG: nuclear transport factor 2 family protein [Actinobacteria bacterium]|nr:nuclear transport factor 2 family protein [Actinomycetota bacterium]